MAIDYMFIGWCHEDNHDKIWTAFKVNNNYYCGWGRRGKAISFKKHDYRSKLMDLINQKENKGYIEVGEKMLLDIFPNFKEEVESRLMFAVLANKIK